MTFAPLSRRLALLATLTSSLWLASCGSSGGSGGGQANIRGLNLTSDLASIDVYLGTTKQFSALNTGALASYGAVEAASYTVNVNSAGNSSTLFTGSYSLAKDGHYTAVVWGTQSSLRVSSLPEDEDASTIGAGNTKVRMFNATTETGAVDVYFTTPTADLGASTPTQGSLPAGTLAGFKEIPAGTYRLRITGVGKPDDLRLDIPAVTLTAAKYSTLVVTAGAGGVLVNGTLVEQQASATALANNNSRVRVIASVDTAGVVAATAGNTTLGCVNAPVAEASAITWPLPPARQLRRSSLVSTAYSALNSVGPLQRRRSCCGGGSSVRRSFGSPISNSQPGEPATGTAVPPPSRLTLMRSPCTTTSTGEGQGWPAAGRRGNG